MKLSAPKFLTFLISLILFVLAIWSPAFLPAFLTAKILYIASYALLALACLLKGL